MMNIISLNKIASQKEDYQLEELQTKIARLLKVAEEEIQNIIEIDDNMVVVYLKNDEGYTYYKDTNILTEILDEKSRKKKSLLTAAEKDQYYEENKKLIYFAIKKISKPDGVDFTELESVGLYGFVKALNTFDKSNGTKFSTYSVKCILNEIYYFLRKEQKHLSMVDSLDKEISTDKNGNTLTIGDTVSDTLASGEKSLEERVMLLELHDVLIDALDYLEDDEKYLITYRYGLDNGIIKKQTDIAKELSMSQANVSKLERTCLKKLRGVLKRKNYLYDPKRHRLESTGLSSFISLEIDPDMTYMPRDSAENIEILTAEILGIDIDEIEYCKTTDVKNLYEIKLLKNNRIIILFNNITCKYELKALPLSNRDRLVYIALGVPCGELVTKEELLDEIYACKISDKDFNNGLNLLTELEKTVLEYRYGLNGKKMLGVTDIQNILHINWKELNQADKAALTKLQNYWWSVI